MRMIREIATPSGAYKVFCEKVSDNKLTHYKVPVQELMLTDVETFLKEKLGSNITVIPYAYSGKLESITLSGDKDALFKSIKIIPSTLQQRIKRASDNPEIKNKIPFLKYHFMRIIANHYDAHNNYYRKSFLMKIAASLVNYFFDKKAFDALYTDYRDITPCTYLAVTCTEIELLEAYQLLSNLIYNNSEQITGQLSNGIQAIKLADTIGDGYETYAVYWFGFFRSTFTCMLEELKRNFDPSQSLSPGVNELIKYSVREGSVGPYLNQDPRDQYEITNITLTSEKMNYDETYKSGSYSNLEDVSKFKESLKKKEEK